MKLRYGKPEMDDKLTEVEEAAYAKLSPDERAAIDAMAERIAGQVRNLGVIGARELLCRLGMYMVLGRER